MHATLDRFLAEAAALEMPEPARLALSAVTASGIADRHWLLENILSDRISEDSAAPHLFVGAAVQLHLARLAATLDASKLVKIRTGTCPTCGGKPATSSVMGQAGFESTQYATCGCCAKQWNEVRVVCLCCGSNAAISYRSAETEGDRQGRGLRRLQRLGQDPVSGQERQPGSYCRRRVQLGPRHAGEGHRLPARRLQSVHRGILMAGFRALPSVGNRRFHDADRAAGHRRRAHRSASVGLSAYDRGQDPLG